MSIREGKISFRFIYVLKHYELDKKYEVDLNYREKYL